MAKYSIIANVVIMTMVYTNTIYVHAQDQARRQIHNVLILGEKIFKNQGMPTFKETILQGEKLAIEEKDKKNFNYLISSITLEHYGRFMHDIYSGPEDIDKDPFYSNESQEVRINKIFDAYEIYDKNERLKMQLFCKDEVLKYLNIEDK